MISAEEDMPPRRLSPEELQERLNAQFWDVAYSFAEPGFLVDMLDSEGANVNSSDRSKWTALHFIAGNERAPEEKILRSLQVLVERGADVQAFDIEGSTPLSVAICRKDGNRKIADAFYDAALKQAKSKKEFFECISKLATASTDPLRNYLLEKIKAATPASRPVQTAIPQALRASL